MELGKDYNLIRVMYLDIRSPRGMMRKYITNDYDAHRWFRALNSLTALMNNVSIVEYGHTIVVDLIHEEGGNCEN